MRIGGLIGLILSLIPIIGSCGLGILLFIREKYKLLFIPSLTILFFIFAATANREVVRQRNHLTTSLSQTIENNIFSISFPADEKFTIEQFSNTVRNSLSQDIMSDTILFEDIELYKTYQKIIDKCYTIYETEYTKNISNGVSFYIPVADKKEIQAELNSFCSRYARMKYADSNFFNFSVAAFMLLWLFSIPFTTYIFSKYLYKPQNGNFGYIVQNAPTQRSLNDKGGIDIDEIVSAATEPQSPVNITQSLVKINYISEADINEQLGATIIQAKMILAERETNGNFLDFTDFLKRTNLSERFCNQFKDRLDFSLNKQSGRIFDI